MTVVTALRAGRRQPAIERASSSDRAFLAMDVGHVPEQFGVILMLESGSGLNLACTRELLADRIAAVPRLRQRLTRAPFGCGGPIWIDDQAFDIRDHVRTVMCPEPDTEQQLLNAALSVIMSPLPRSAPLWSAVLLTSPVGDALALVIVLHHALADGIGGLAVLTSLIDAPLQAADAYFPRPAPAASALALDAFAAKLRALGNSRKAWQLLRLSIGAGGGLRPPRANSCSLNQRTGSRRRLAVVHADHAAVSAAAHQHGATTNDAILVAVADGLRQILLGRGQPAGAIVVTVPVSGRLHASRRDLGNMVSPLLVRVPTAGEAQERLRQVATQVRAHKAAAIGPPPIALLGWLFRLLAALGGYRWYLDHQHRFHTLVSHVRGPAAPVTFAGARITAAIPAGVGPGGNIPVHFEALSYAGSLAVSVITDPDHFPELNALTDALRTELGRLVHQPTG
ncbi:MAG TPA: wax ester/triacylglycerol synthase domain-containing protein [Actinocrinis sp.]|nr:wax ester/triacylglycerol synthase domain-containing protein [Actinocrinis sp.]